MGATRFLTSEHATDGSAQDARSGKIRLVVGRNELAVAIAALGGSAGIEGKPTSAGRALRASDLALPALAHSLVAHAGAISIDEYKRDPDASGRATAVATGRKLSGIAALQALQAGFGANNTFRSVELDERAVARSNEMAIPAEARYNQSRLEEAKSISAGRDPKTAGSAQGAGWTAGASKTSRAARWNERDSYLRGA